MALDKLAFVRRWLNDLRDELAKLEAQKLMHESIVERDELKIEELLIKVETAEEYLQGLP